MNKKLIDYIDRTRPEFYAACLKYLDDYGQPCGGAHPGIQKEPGGLAVHIVQVIEKALELNQQFDEQTIIETCLAHDLKHWQDLPLDDRQTVAVFATKGLPWKVWRKSPHYHFVALILIADMWSAYVNVENREK